MKYQHWIMLFLCLTTILTGFFLFQYRKNIKIIQQKYQLEIKNISGNITSETELQKETILNENKKLLLHSFVDKNNTSLSLKSLFNRENKILVFAIPDGMCQVCYDATFVAYENFVNSVGIEKTFVLCSKNRFREVTALFKNKNVKILATNFEDRLISPFKGYVPFFFVLDSAIAAKNIFFPRKGNDKSLTHFYLNDFELTSRGLSRE